MCSNRLKRLCPKSDSAYCYTFLRTVVCLSSVTFVHPACLNHSTYLLCVRWRSLTPRGSWDLGVKPPAKTCSACEPSVLCCHQANRNEDKDWFRLLPDYLGPCCSYCCVWYVGCRTLYRTWRGRMALTTSWFSTSGRDGCISRPRNSASSGGISLHSPPTYSSSSSSSS